MSGVPVAAEQRLRELEIILPAPAKPGGNFVHAALAGNILFLSGTGPRTTDGRRVTGKVGVDVTVEEAYHHAFLAGLMLLANARREVGSLDRVVRVARVFGMVNTGPGFNSHPSVIDGCSDLFVNVFGERGRHARSAVGMHSLPFDISVEIEAAFEVEV